jgi:hypothetical protein
MAVGKSEHKGWVLNEGDNSWWDDTQAGFWPEVIAVGEMDHKS